jgi:hypothetical protein
LFFRIPRSADFNLLREAHRFCHFVPEVAEHNDTGKCRYLPTGMSALRVTPAFQPAGSETFQSRTSGTCSGASRVKNRREMKRVPEIQQTESTENLRYVGSGRYPVTFGPVDSCPLFRSVSVTRMSSGDER